MNEFNKAIAELKKKISMQDTEIIETKHKIGNELSGIEPEKIKATPLFESFEKIRELRKEIPVKKDMIQEIKDIDEQLENLHQKIMELKGLVSERERIFKSIYENIGNAAYTAYKLNQEKLESYEHIFTELIRQDVKSEQFNKVDVSGQPEDKNIIRQFMDTAKSMYRNQRHKFMLSRYPGLYRQAGKTVLSTNFLKDAADETADKAAKSLIENENAVKQLNNEIVELENNKAGLRKKLISLDVKGRSYKKIHELETEIKNIDVSIRDFCIGMGEIFLDRNLTEVIGNPKAAEYARIISGLKQANEECNAEIKRYETLIALERVDNKIVRTTNKLEHIKNLVAKQELEMKSLQKELAQLEKQKKNLEKTLEKIPGQGNITVPEKKESVETQ